MNKKNIILLLGLVLLIMTGTAERITASMLADFENQSLWVYKPADATVNYSRIVRNGTTFDIRAGQGPDCMDAAIVSPGAENTSYAAKFILKGPKEKCVYDAPHIGDRSWRIWIYDANRYNNFKEAKGCNRLSFLIKFPKSLKRVSGAYNIHIGTYTTNPEEPTHDLFPHFYHWVNINGAGEWQKVILNQHPQCQTSSSEEIKDNPTLDYGWNYTEGLKRIYIIVQGNVMEQIPSNDFPFEAYIDEIKFYHENETENTETINTLVLSYFGNGYFELDWQRNGSHTTAGPTSYEVRYSTSKINNSNFDNAELCSAFTWPEGTGGINDVHTNCTIKNIVDGQRYYFAIRDLAIPYITKIDYFVPLDKEPPVLSSNYSQYYPPGTSNLNLIINTNENSTCKYSNIPNTDFYSMQNILVTSDFINHTLHLTNLQDGNDYIYYIKCKDSRNNTNKEDYIVHFSIRSNEECLDMDNDNFFNLIGCGTPVDCNDFDVNINPSQKENCTNGIDDNCNGLIDCDDNSCFSDSACSVTLVDFGNSESDNIYGLEGWDSVFMASYTNYVDIGPKGTTITIGSNGAYNYQGIQGDFRNFTAGEKIKVTWYNNAPQHITFTPLISFNDPDRVDSGTEGQWYPMSTIEIAPHSSQTSEFVFNDTTAGEYNLVNVNVNYDNYEELICDKIVLFYKTSTTQKHCIHESDTDCDGHIQLGELLSYIRRWLLHTDIPMNRVIEAVKLWKKGCSG